MLFRPLQITGRIATDQMVRFPKTSSKGNKYIMACYVYDTNGILTECMRSREDKELTRAFTAIYDSLVDRGLTPTIHFLDNECPPGLAKFMKLNNIQFQLVPPHDHRSNPAEKAIGTWKDHFIAGLSSINPDFPLHLWCRLVNQATTTLNLLRPSNRLPHMSAEAHMNGAFDFNKTPMPPPAQRSSSTRRPRFEAHGPRVGSTDGTSAMPQITTAATDAISPKLEPSASPAR